MMFVDTLRVTTAAPGSMTAEAAQTQVQNYLHDTSVITIHGLRLSDTIAVFTETEAPAERRECCAQPAFCRS